MHMGQVPGEPRTNPYQYVPDGSPKINFFEAPCATGHGPRHGAHEPPARPSRAGETPGMTHPDIVAHQSWQLLPLIIGNLASG